MRPPSWAILSAALRALSSGCSTLTGMEERTHVQGYGRSPTHSNGAKSGNPRVAGRSPTHLNRANEWGTRQVAPGTGAGKQDSLLWHPLSCDSSH